MYVGQDDGYFKGFDDSGSGVHLFDYGKQPVMAADAEWVDVEFDACIDSGCVEHVCDDVDTPGYAVEASAGSRRGSNFIVGNGGQSAEQGPGSS